MFTKEHERTMRDLLTLRKFISHWKGMAKDCPSGNIKAFALGALIFGFQGFRSDYPFLVLHLVLGGLLMFLTKIYKDFSSSAVSFLMITAAAYPSILLATCPLKFVFSWILACLTPLLITSLNLSKSHQILYLASSLCGWLFYTVAMRVFVNISNENQVFEPFWSQFLTLFLGANAFSLYSILSKKKPTDVITSMVPHPTQQSEALEVESKSAGSTQELSQAPVESFKQTEGLLFQFSHEIRNPLNGLLGNIDLALESIKDPEIVEIISDAKLSGEILLQLLNNILDSSKIDSGRLEISPVECNIREFFEKVWLITNDIMRKKSLYGAVNISNSLPTYIKVDPHRLVQIILNLTTNAAKFTEKGSVKWHIDYVSGTQIQDQDLKPKHFSFCPNEEAETSFIDIDEKHSSTYELLDTTRKRFRSHTGSMILSDSDELKGYLRLEIVDSGSGMSQTAVMNLFKKFEQVSEEATKRQLGTGLGLWITKEIVELMNGKIEVYSAQGFGTCFVILLETEVVPRNSSIVKMPPILSFSSLACKKALVVTASSYDRDTISRYLYESHIGDVITAPSSTEALEIFKNKGRDYFHVITVSCAASSIEEDRTVELIHKYEESKGWKSTMIIEICNESNKHRNTHPLEIKRGNQATVSVVRPISLESIQNALAEIERMQLQDHVVLVAEDDYFNLNLLGNFLEKMGVTYLKARNGREAIEIYSQNASKIRLVLMDCEMPIVNGFTAAKEIIRRQEESGITANIYGLTGHQEDKYRMKCKEAGMKDMLTKPINFTNLKKLILLELSKSSQ